MTAHYSLFRNPKRENEEGESTLHARLVDQHTIRMEDLNEEMSDACSFNSADVKGILDALRSRIIMHLKRGEILELEGIGTFSISLKCPAWTDEKAIKPKHVKFNKVVFRCAKELRRELSMMSVERAESGSRLKLLPADKRKKNILNYLQTHQTITSFICCGLNACTKYMALKDIAELKEAGKIVQLGRPTNAQYMLAKGREGE